MEENRKQNVFPQEQYRYMFTDICRITFSEGYLKVLRSWWKSQILKNWKSKKFNYLELHNYFIMHHNL